MAASREMLAAAVGHGRSRMLRARNAEGKLTFLGARLCDPCEDRTEADEASSVMVNPDAGVLRWSEWVRPGKSAHGSRQR